MGFTSEHFEWLLGSFYLSLAPLDDSPIDDDVGDFQKALSVLDGYAERHGVRSPEDVVMLARAPWKPVVFSSTETLFAMVNSFKEDFGLDTSPETEDGMGRYDLAMTLLRVYDRHGIAEIEYIDDKPCAVKEWDRFNSTQTLEKVLYLERVSESAYSCKVNIK